MSVRLRMMKNNQVISSSLVMQDNNVLSDRNTWQKTPKGKVYYRCPNEHLCEISKYSIDKVEMVRGVVRHLVQCSLCDFEGHIVLEGWGDD